MDGRRGIPPNNPVSLLRRFQRAFTARLATHSKVESPSSRLRIPNSTRREPAPAVQVSLLLSGGTPVFRFTCNKKNQKLCGSSKGIKQLPQHLGGQGRRVISWRPVSLQSWPYTFVHNSCNLFFETRTDSHFPPASTLHPCTPPRPWRPSSPCIASPPSSCLLHSTGLLLHLHH